MGEGPRPVDLFQVTCGQQVEKAWLKPRLHPLLPMASMGLLRHQVGTHRGWPRSPRAVCLPLSLPMHRHHWATDSFLFAWQSPSSRDPQSWTSQDGGPPYVHEDSKRFFPKAGLLISEQLRGPVGQGRDGLHAGNPQILRSLCPEVPGSARPKLAIVLTFSPRSLDTCLLSFTSHLFPSIIFSTSAEACWGEGAHRGGEMLVRLAHRPVCSLTPKIRMLESGLLSTPLCR